MRFFGVTRQNSYSRADRRQPPREDAQPFVDQRQGRRLVLLVRLGVLARPEVHGRHTLRCEPRHVRPRPLGLDASHPRGHELPHEGVRCARRSGRRHVRQLDPRTVSHQRADAVKQYLMDKYGFPGSRLRTSGSGPDKPIDTNATAEGREKNRRTDIKLYANPGQ